MHVAVAAISAALPPCSEAQVWFSADSLFWANPQQSDRAYVFTNTEDSDAEPVTFELIRSNDTAPEFRSGYRFCLGSGVGDFEVEGSVLEFDGWSATAYRRLPSPLSLDAEFANSDVFPNDSHSLAFTSGIGLSAASAEESLEAELLTGRSNVVLTYASDLRDLQLNFCTHRDLHWLRWGIGYRHLRVNTTSSLALSGTFDARDTIIEPPPDPNAPTNNNGLSNDALIAAGFKNLVSDDGFDAIDDVVGTSDTLTVLFDGRAENRLHGLQLTGGMRSAWSDILWFDGLLRLGVFHNQITGYTSERLTGGGDDDSIYLRALDDRKASVAFAVNPSVRATLSVTEHVAITGGYDLLYLWGIADGPEQIGRVQVSAAKSPTYALDSSGEFVAHGGSFGVEIRW